MSRPTAVLASSVWPISDLEGVNGDYVMFLGTNSTCIMYGPKANNTWVGVNKCILTNQLEPQFVYLVYKGDQSGFGQVGLPTPGTGVNGQFCLLLDVLGNCSAVAQNINGVWNPLIKGFNSQGIIATNDAGAAAPSATSGD